MATPTPFARPPDDTARSISSWRRQARPDPLNRSMRTPPVSTSATLWIWMEPTSTASTARLSRRDMLILVIVASLGASIYLVTSAITYRVGYPLDDSWIHETYARNLAS